MGKIKYVLVLLHSFLSKECFVDHDLLLTSWFRQVRKQDTMEPEVGLGSSGLEGTLSVKGNGDSLEDG